MSSESPIFTITDPPKIIPVVLPPSADRSLSGRVRNISVRGVDHSGWLMPTRQGWRLDPDRTLQGYVLLEDLYRAEGNEEGWATYKRYIADWQKGKTSRPFPLHLLPQEVQKRQRGDIGAEFEDPWNLPAPAPTTGVVSDAKPKVKKGE